MRSMVSRVIPNPRAPRAAVARLGVRVARPPCRRRTRGCGPCRSRRRRSARWSGRAPWSWCAVDESERDGQPGLAGDPVEARLPASVPPARAIGRDHETENLARPDALDDFRDHETGESLSTGMPPSHRMIGPRHPRKRLFLPSQRMCMVEPPGDGEHEHEVPVRRVRCPDEHRRAIRSGFRHETPSAKRPEHTGHEASEQHDSSVSCRDRNRVTAPL